MFPNGLFYAMTMKSKKATIPLSGDALQKRLGARIRSLREQKGYTNYEKFAYAHDISRSQFGRYENGEDMRFSTLIRIVKAFDMTLEEFFSEGFD